MISAVTPLGAAPRRILSRRIYDTGNPRRSLLDFADPAVTDGRYHRKPRTGVWCASFRERGAWAELFRHHESAEISRSKVRCRVGRARTDELEVLDLTKRSVQALLQLTNDDLAGESYEGCRRVAEAARAAGSDGLLPASGALSVETTLVVFADAMREGKVSEERSRIGTQPRRMLAHLLPIRVRGAAAKRIRRLYRRITGQAARPSDGVRIPVTQFAAAEGGPGAIFGSRARAARVRSAARISAQPLAQLGSDGPLRVMKATA